MTAFKRFLLLLIMLTFIVPSGCWDLADVNDHIFILGLGIDKDETAGLFRFTFHYANPRGEASDSSSGTMTYINTTIRSSSLSLAVRELIRNSDSEANFEHMQTLVLGIDYLSDLSFDDIDMLFRMASVRRKCVVVTSDGKASDLLSMKFSGMSTAIMINRLSNHYTSANSNILEGFSLTSLYSKKSDNLSFYLLSVGAVENSNYTVLSITDQPDAQNISIAVTGISVFNNCRYAGRLGYSELETIRLLFNRQSEGIVNITSEDNSSVCYQIISSKCDRSCVFTNGQPDFTIKLDIECLLIDSSDDTISDGKKMIKEDIEKKINNLILLSKNKYGAELLGLETATRQKNRKWFDENRDFWNNKYTESKISVEIDCRIVSEGIIE